MRPRHVQVAAAARRAGDRPPAGRPRAYTDRYSEPDKAATGLGAGAQAWPAPYWTIDTAMAVMTLLLAAEDAGLGALFFGVFKGERGCAKRLGIPPGLDLLGAIALGHPRRRAGRAKPPGRERRARRRRPTRTRSSTSAVGERGRERSSAR